MACIGFMDTASDEREGGGERERSFSLIFFVAVAFIALLLMIR